MLHKSIVVGNSSIAGRGLFASQFIPEGSIIWQRNPNEKHYHISEIMSWSKEKQELFFSCSYQVGLDLYYGMDGSEPDDADFMNHSCDPNTWFVSDILMVARRDILPGEEITYDYITSEISDFFYLHCSCNSPLCRKVICRDNLFHFPELCQRYRGHFMSHVEQFLKQQGLL